MRLPLKIASAAALAGALLTLGLFEVGRRVLDGAFREKLRTDVSTRARIVREKLEASILIARAASSFAESGKVFEPGAFESFAEDFLDETTGLTAISFVAVVPGSDRALFESRAGRLLGRQDYVIYEGVPGVRHEPPKERSIYYPVLFTHTRDASAVVVLGFDLGSSPVRLAALERARDTGEATVTGRITLVGTAGKHGFIIFYPVYDTAKPTSSPAERRAALKGFVQAIFSPDDLVATALRTTPPVGLPFDLLDLTAAEADRVIAHWAARLDAAAAWRSRLHPRGVRVTEKFHFAGRTWGIDVSPNAAYLNRNYSDALWLIPPIGLALTLVLAVYLYTVLSRREELAAEIDKRGRVEEALRASERRYRIVADNTGDWEFWLDPGGRFLYCSPSSEPMTGFADAAFLADPSLLNRIMMPDDLESFERHRLEETTRPAPATLAFRIRHRDGGTRWIDHVCQPVFDEDGRFIGTRGSNRDITEKKRIEEERERLIAELREAQNSIRTLEGILPICSSCKRIREADDSWMQVETYVSRHSSAEFTHGLCPECTKRLYPDFWAKRHPGPPA